MSVVRRMMLAAWVVLAVVSFAGAQSFLDTVDVEPLRYVSVQDHQTIKTFDTFARQELSTITGKTSWEGVGATAVVLDMAFRPDQWKDRNVIKVKNAPLRKDFEDFKGLDAAEKERIVKEGTVSLSFLMREDVVAFLEMLQGQAQFKQRAVDELMSAGATMKQLSSLGPQLPAAVIAPRAEGDRKWKLSAEIAVNVPRYAEMMKAHAAGMTPPPPQEGYAGQEELLGRIIDAQRDLAEGWQNTDTAAVNSSITKLATMLPQVSLETYPSMAKRKTEVVYNSLGKMTLPGAFLYFIAFTLFLLSVYSGLGGMRKWALGFYIFAFAIHTLAIGVRWWLVSKSVGNWFESIPIKNQFESVMFSAWFGALVGLVLELWKGKGIWGTAASFVGWMSLVAIFSAPFVAGRDIGGEIGMVQGVLMSYWLYIHVTMVTASYALIGMSFMLGCWWLLKYYFGNSQGGTRIVEERIDGGVGGGGMLAMAGGGTVERTVARKQAAVLVKGPSLATLDSCNLVILQLAFWVLGVGIILGAVWADQSWGRPWGWDPKETFALVTWIIYLTVVHVRLATVDKAWWTAVLSVVGFAVMLFNWIGVNFFLVGLHSYA